jgi:hypothetical protein
MCRFNDPNFPLKLAAKKSGSTRLNEPTMSSRPPGGDRVETVGVQTCGLQRRGAQYADS